MHIYEARKFNIPALEGLSQKTIDAHIGLYEGYVKNFNAISKQIAELATTDSEKYAHAVSELVRRRGFEFGGMRLHELYFEQFEGGAAPLAEDSPLAAALTAAYAPVGFPAVFKAIGSMRGPGWAVLYYDPTGKELLTAFVEEHQLGHFAGLPIVLILDVWEHAFLLDFGTAGKGGYIDAFFKNLNWTTVEKRFAALCE
jgi:Fe-Mn family superoxide dismutase